MKVKIKILKNIKNHQEKYYFLRFLSISIWIFTLKFYIFYKKFKNFFNFFNFINLFTNLDLIKKNNNKKKIFYKK